MMDLNRTIGGDALTLEVLHKVYEKLRCELQPLVGYFMAKEDIDTLKTQIEASSGLVKDKSISRVPGLFCIYGLSIIESKLTKPGRPIPFGLNKDGRIVPIIETEKSLVTDA